MRWKIALCLLLISGCCNYPRLVIMPETQENIQRKILLQQQNELIQKQNEYWRMQIEQEKENEKAKESKKETRPYD